MFTAKMHADEIDINFHLVHKLLSVQFPDWANLELKLIRPEETDNVMYKLGDDKVIRLPRTEGSATNVKKECRWLPHLAAFLPIAIPTLLAEGRPSADYNLPWYICQFLEGKNPNTETMLDHHQTAIDLGNFVSTMQKIDSKNGPKCRRGQPLNTRDQETREAINLLSDTYDADLVTDIWGSALAAPIWSKPPVWIHEDLHAGNLLAQNGRITAIVDFGSAGIGDPACDLMVAWTLLTSETRDTFRSIVQPDDATWARARGWALTFGIVAFPYYRLSNPVFASIAKRALDEVLTDYK
jgi:aminoglycoside phosphotransferase (APT) family kinase protein